jgi:hypothetical protein
MTTSNLEKELNTLAQKLGFGKVSSYAKLWGTTINTYSSRSASMWFFTINLNVDNQVVGISIHTTYFKHTPQTNKINKVATFDTPISVAKAIELIS